MDGGLWEVWIMFQYSSQWTVDYVSFAWNQISLYNSLHKAVMLHADPDPSFIQKPDIDPERVAMYSLATYYLIAQVNTYFDYQDASHYSRPRDDWFDAISFNVGVPTSDWYVFESWIGGYPTNVTLPNYVSNGDFEFESAASNYTLPANWSCQRWTGQVNCSLSSDSHTGAKSAMITITNSTFVGGFYQPVSLLPFSNYTVSVWIKIIDVSGEKLDTSIARAYVYPGPNGKSGTASVTDGGLGKWILAVGQFSTGSDTTGSYLYCGQVLSMVGAALFDNCKIEEGFYTSDRIFARNYTNARVFMRPLDTPGANYGENTATTIDLESSYYPLLFIMVLWDTQHHK